MGAGYAGRGYRGGILKPLSGIARTELQPMLNYFEDVYVGRPQRAAGHGRQRSEVPAHYVEHAQCDTPGRIPH